MAAFMRHIVFIVHLATSILFILALVTVSEETADQPKEKELEVFLRLGVRGLLPCNAGKEKTLGAIYWDKGSSQQTADFLVQFDFFNQNNDKSGPGLDDGLYDIITDNFSLVINEVRVDDDDRFFCRAVDSGSGFVYINSTLVRVFSPPSSPFPIIEECDRAAEPSPGQEQPCTVSAPSTPSITCSVLGYYPTIDLHFFHGATKVEPLTSAEWNNTDGTRKKSVTIAAVGSSEPFTCVASNVPGSSDKDEEFAVSFYVSTPSTHRATEEPSRSSTDGSESNQVKSGPNTSVIVAIVLICAVIIVAVVVLLLYRKHRKHRSNQTDRPDIVNTEIGKLLPHPVEETSTGKQQSVPLPKPDPSSLTPGEVDNCRADLLQYYNDVLSGIQTDIFDQDSSVSFKDLYTDVYLLEESLTKRKDEDGKPPLRFGIFPDFDAHKGKRSKMTRKLLSNESFRDLIGSHKPPYRLLLIGEAGVGKTTLLGKLTNDWMTGKDFQHIKLIFRIPFRDSEQTETFGEVVQKYLSDTKVYGKRLDEYIRTNQDKVMLLLDGLDEFAGNIITENSALAKIMRGEKFKKCVVIITTRPSSADAIINAADLVKRFTYVSVEGFNEENINNYTEKFFQDDLSLGQSLQKFLHEDKEVEGIFSLIMAPFPIFLAMLCHVWRGESEKQMVNKLQSVSQLMNRMVDTLKEHYVLKAAKSGYGKPCDDRHQHASMCLKEVGRIAYPHVLSRQLVFGEKEISGSLEFFKTACDVGLLSKEKEAAPYEDWKRDGKRFILEHRIPHLLLLDFLAALHLATLYSTSHAEFKQKLEDLIERSREKVDTFEYLWYFTVAQGKEVGHACLEILLEEVNDKDFLLRVAFECHDKDVAGPVNNFFLQKKSLRMKKKRAIPAYFYVMDTSKNLETLILNVLPEGEISSRKAAETIFSLETLRTLVLQPRCGKYGTGFYSGMEERASASKIQNLIHQDDNLGIKESRTYANAVFTMPHLRVFVLGNVILDEDFYKAIGEVASNSEMDTLWISNPDEKLGSTSARNFAQGILSMTKIETLNLTYCTVDSEFYRLMEKEGANSQIRKLAIECRESLDPDASLKGVLALRSLRTLLANVNKQDKSSFPEVSKQFAETQIERVWIFSLSNLSGEAARNVASGFLTMPRLKSLRIHQPGKEFLDTVFLSAPDTLSSPRPFLQITTLVLEDAEITKGHLRSILSHTTLTSLRFVKVRTRVGTEESTPDEPLQKPLTNISSVVELGVDDASLPGLIQLDLHTLCSKIKRVRIDLTSDLKPDILELLHRFSAIDSLHFVAYKDDASDYFPSQIELIDVSTLCDSMKTSWASLKTLMITDISLGDANANKLLAAANKLSNFENLTLMRCGTTSEIDEEIQAVTAKGEGRMHTKTIHGVPESSSSWNDDVHWEEYTRYFRDYLDSPFVVFPRENKS